MPTSKEQLQSAIRSNDPGEINRAWTASGRKSGRRMNQPKAKVSYYSRRRFVLQ